MNPSRIYQSFKNGHSRSSGNVLNQSLDSGLRRAAPGILPSRRIQDFLSINDGEAKIKTVRLPVCVYRFVVIPAKAGIQEGDDGVPQGTLIQSEIP